jgi:hypothetical protein
MRVQMMMVRGRRVDSADFLGFFNRSIKALALCLCLATASALAQTAGDGAITGTVKDSTGAVVPNASVTAKNDATGVVTQRTTSGGGIYEISPLIIGTYTVTVSAKGFQSFVQQKILLNENQTFGLNATLTIGSTDQSVTVTEAPPQLDTANAVLGGTISATEFADLPLLVAGNQQRDITSFSNLLPGAQPGSRSSLFSGTANRVQEVYLDGLPLTTISQIGDNRPIFNIVPFEGIGEVGALTSGQSVEYQGAGSVNYSMKSGGNKYHGTVADYIRNRILDTWGFSAGYATQPELVNGVVTNVLVGKPTDHQNELALSVGGPIKVPHFYNGHDKLFFEFAYDKVHSRSAPAYALTTIPTTLMQAGDFTELLSSTVINGVAGPGYAIYDPTTQVCTGSPSNCTRSQFMGMKNGLATPNVIPAGEISPIAQKMESYLPQPTVPGIQNNYLGGSPTGYDNWLYSGRIDYTVSPKQQISATVAGGNRIAYPFTSGSGTILPIPYIGTTYTTVAGHWADFSHSYTITPRLVNQFKFGFSNFGGPPARNVTEHTQYAANLQGIAFSGVPSNGQAVNEFPTQTFAGSNAQAQWGEGGSGPSSTTVTETYTMVDNLLLIKGKHAITIGGQFQFIEDNSDSYDGPTSTLTLNYSPNETSQEALTKGAEGFVASTGYSYASYLLGAVDSTGITLQPFSVLGGRYRPFAPYIADDYKISSKLTVNLGLRWDYIPTYQEVLSRFSFLNPTLTNPVTGNPGTLQFAGNNGGTGVGCGCTSPASNYMKNFGPRVGFAYSPTDKIVIRGAYSTLYSHGGGTGGAGGAYNGTGQLGFTSSPSFTPGGAGPSASPAFYLNTSTAFTALGLANANFGGPGYTVPAITAPGPVSQTLNVGNTVNGMGAFVTASGAPGYPDPYLSGRTPEFNFYNIGIEQQITKNLTVILNYAGSQSHFIAGAGNMRGLQSGQINPIYWALGTQLSLPATPANLAAANVTAAAAGIPLISEPYVGFGLAAATAAGAGKATIQQALTWMPQFSSTADTWGSQSANSSYNSAQISIAERLSHGLQFNINYTFSSNIDDAGTQRSGWAIPANRIATGHSYKENRIDRSVSANSVPENLAIFGTYTLPFGKGGYLGDNKWASAILGGFKLSEILTFTSGTPVLITASYCNSTNQPTAGTCMPDINSAYTSSSIRQNGKYGQGLTAKAIGSISYVKGYITNTQPGAGAGTTAAPIACAISGNPFCNAQAFQFGDAPRANDFNLRNPSTYNLNMSLFRSFNLGSERFKFVARVDCQNVTNHVTFSGLSGATDSSAFGTFTGATSNSGSRDFQLSGRFNF